MIHIKGFKQVQIIQNKIDHILFKIVKDRNYSDNSLKILKETVVNIFGTKMNFDTEFVDEIPMTARGKFQFTICNVDNNKG